MAHNRNKTWSCPYFRWDETKSVQAVHCEGGFIRFPDYRTWNDYVDRYCAADRGYRYCTVARALSLYYERIE